MGNKWRDFAQESFTKGTDAGDYDRYVTYFSPDCEVVIGQGQWDEPIRGRETWAAAQREWNDCFSDRPATWILFREPLLISIVQSL